MVTAEGLPSSMRVLLSVARCSLGAVGPAELRKELTRLDPAGLRAESTRVGDWPALLATARTHGMTGTLCKALLEHAGEQLPPAVADEYRGLRRSLAHRALDMSRRLLGVLTLLEKAGVRALAYKGPALSEGLYGDVAVRSWADLDLIVANDDLAAAREALQAAGFSPHAGGALLGADLTTAEQELSFHHPDSGLAIDLHWRVGLRFAGASLDGEDLLRRAVPGLVLDRPVLVPSPADVALLCSLHGASHNWPQLDLVLSAALALQALSDGDAALLETEARRGGCARRAHIGTLLSRALLGARVALPALLPAIGDRRAGRLAASAGARLLWRQELDGVHARRRPGDHAGRRPRGHAGEVLWQLGSLDSAAAAAAHAWERLLRPGALDVEGGAGDAQAHIAGAAAGPVPGGGAAAPTRTASRLRAVWRRQARIWRRGAPAPH